MTTRTLTEPGCYQGDILIERIDALPSELAPVAPGESGYIVAHSETGHHHLAVGPDGGAGGVRYLRPADDVAQTGLVAYLDVLAEHADILHLRAWDTHEPIRLPTGAYRIVRQRESRPEGWARVED